MNIILVSNKFAQARSFAVSTPQVIFLGLLLGLLVVSLAVLMNYFSLRYAVTNQSPYLQSLLEAVQAEQTRKTQSYLRESLNTMAARLGEMQAKLQRLDTLGECRHQAAGIHVRPGAGARRCGVDHSVEGTLDGRAWRKSGLVGATGR